jgi:hypothetical protein
MMSMDQREQFLSELKALLEKYRVSIGFEVGECSDTFGLYDEKIVIDHRVDGLIFPVWKTWLETPGWNLGADDINLEK